MPKRIQALFLVVMILGYITALINLYLSDRMADMSPGLGVNDIITKFHGNPLITRLTEMINGPMRQYLETEAEKDRIEAWVAAGSLQDGYEDVAPVFRDRCIRCHDLFGKAEFAPLTSYEAVTRYTVPHPGITWSRLAKLSHQHFLGMGLLFLGVSYVLFYRPQRRDLKLRMAGAAFVLVMADVGGWWLVKIWAPGAYLVASAGALHALVFFAMCGVCFWEMIREHQTR